MERTTEIKRESVIPTGFRSAKERWVALFNADCVAYTVESTLPPASDLLARLDDFTDMIREFWGITGNLTVTGYDSDGSYIKLFGEIDGDHGTIRFSTPKIPFADDKLCTLADTDADVRDENKGLLFNDAKALLARLEEEVIGFIMGERGEEETPDLPFADEEGENLLNEDF